MTALELNDKDNYDSDTLRLLLTELAKGDPKNVKAQLEDLSRKTNQNELKNINWLLEFCL